MKHDYAERINLKIVFLWMIVKSGININHNNLFLRFFDQYLLFTKGENKKW